MAKKNVQVVQRVSPRTVTSSSLNVDFQREELNMKLPDYYLIRDVLAGEKAIKGMMVSVSSGVAGSFNGGMPLTTLNFNLTQAKRYLPQPNEADQSQKNINRYKAYVQRAVFYNVTARTHEGLIGQIFLRPPESTIPPELDVLKKDADGAGLGLDQVAKKAVRYTTAYGRSGLLVDFPRTTGPITKAQQADGGFHPVLLVYDPCNIVNWRVEMKNAEQIITLVVLREVMDEIDEEGFGLTSVEQYRVLRLDGGVHTVSTYRKTTNGGFDQILTDVVPTDANGKPFNRIPFKFIGSENNDSLPDKPPLLDLSVLNIAHYRNSADYEEACFQMGQPTAVVTGLSQDWYENILKKELPVGSRSGIPLPTGADMKFEQAQPNSMPLEAMEQKEAQMIALGAKLVVPQKSSRTATEKIIDTTSESSPLASISTNVSEAMLFGLQQACAFVGSDPEEVKYALNKDFDLTSMTADDQNAVVMQWQSAAISFSELRTVLKRAGTATLPDDEARSAIKQDIKDGLIPDPSLSAQPQARAPVSKAESNAGGPQPKTPRRQPSPGTSA